MHQRCRLILNRLGQMRVAMAKQVDRNSTGKIKITFTALTNQISTFTSYRTHAAPGINGHQRGNRHNKAFLCNVPIKKGDPEWPPDRE